MTPFSLDQDQEEKVTSAPTETFLFFFPFIRPYLGRLLFAGFMLTIMVACDLAIPLCLKKILDTHLPARDFLGMQSTLAFALACFLTRVGLMYNQALMLGRTGLAFIRDLKKKILGHVLDLDLRFHHRNNPGRLLQRIESDAETLKQLFSLASLNIFRTLLTFAGIFFILFQQDAKLALLVILFISLFLPLVIWLYRSMEPLLASAKKKQGDINSLVEEYVHNIPLLQVFQFQRQALEKLAAGNQDFFRSMLRWEMFFYSYTAAFLYSEIILNALVIAFAGRSLVLGTLTVGALVVFFEFSRLIFQPLVELSEYLHGFQNFAVSAERIRRLLLVPPELLPVPSPVHPGFEARIQFENLDFGYEEDQKVLENIQLEIPRGEMIALVGPSGGGKSTLMNLLFRFFDPTRGRITVDGVDIREFKIEDWRKKIGLILQDIRLLPVSLLDNIRMLDPGISEDRVIALAKELGAEDFLLEEGPGGPRLRGAVQLSRGESQFLAFIRAIIREPEILILDEATAAMDLFSEEKLLKILWRLKGKTTLFVIAHRLNTVQQADRVCFLEGGRVVECGKPAELLARNGRYAAYCRLQKLTTGGEGGANA